MYASHGSRREMESCLVDGDRVSPRLPRSSTNAMLEFPRARGRGGSALNSRGKVGASHDERKVKWSKSTKAYRDLIFPEGGALCPSKSGLMNKHIVKHIVVRR